MINMPTTAPVSSQEELRALAIVSINKMVGELALHPKDVWTYFNQVNGAVALSKDLSLITSDEAAELLRKATEARLIVCIEPAPVSSEFIQDLNERLLQIKVDPAQAWARYISFETKIRSDQEFYLISDEDADNYLAAAVEARDSVTGDEHRC
jgi:hypothetical protein